MYKQKLSNFFLRILPLAILCVFTVTSIGISSAASPSGFYFSSSSQNITTGSTFTANVRLNTSQEVDSLHIVITYPANLLQITSLSSGSEPFEFSLANDTGTSGSITMERYSVTGAPSGITGDNYIAAIKFKAKSAGNATLAFASETAAARGGPIVPTQNNSKTFVLASPASVPQNTNNNSVASTTPTTSGETTAQNQTQTNTTSASDKPQKKQADSNTTSPDIDGQPAGEEQTVYNMNLFIKNKNKKPLNNAAVTLGSNASANTNANGVVTFENLMPGEYPLTINYKGKSYKSNLTIADNPAKKDQFQEIILDIKGRNYLMIVIIGFFILSFIGASVIIGRHVWRKERLNKKTLSNTNLGTSLNAPASYKKISETIAARPESPGTIVRPDPGEPK